MGLRMKTLIFFVFTEKSDVYGVEFMKNHYRGGDCLKRGAWTVCRFKGGLGKKGFGGGGG